MRTRQRKTKFQGYALLDVVLAVALFALTVTGLISVMQRINETSAGFAKDRLLQGRLSSILAETRQLPVTAMTTDRFDETLDMQFRTYAEPYEIDNGEGEALGDLYLLSAEAVFVDDGGEQTERISVLIHRPQE